MQSIKKLKYLEQYPYTVVAVHAATSELAGGCPSELEDDILMFATLRPSAPIRDRAPGPMISKAFACICRYL